MMKLQKSGKVLGFLRRETRKMTEEQKVHCRDKP